MSGEGDPFSSRWSSDVKVYYELRAAEYDATTYELARQDPVSARDLDELERLVGSLPPARTVDIGCGTGWLTRFLRGSVVGVDQSESMLNRARAKLPDAVLVLADVPPLPFPARSFDRAFASHFYSHVESEEERRALVDEALRVADELVVIEQPWRSGLPREHRESRSLADGSDHLVYKRYLTAAALADELGGWVILETQNYVGAAVRR